MLRPSPTFHSLALVLALAACTADDAAGTTDTASSSSTATSDGTATTAMGTDSTATTATTASSETGTTNPGTTTTASSTTDPSTSGTTATTDPSTSGTTATTDPSTSGTTDPSTSGTTGGNAVCGNGMVEAGEECDDGANNSDILQGACRSDCSAAGCGDGVLDYVLGEECDDGNAMGGDKCSAACAVEVTAACGDGKLDLDKGEECDDGNKSGGDGCSATCQFEELGLKCGDGKVDPLEVCDDKNLQNGDACNPTCNLGNKTSLFVGTPGMGGLKDGIGMAARIQGGTLAVDNKYLWNADGQSNVVRRIDLATASVVTIAGDPLGTAGDVDNATGTLARFKGVESIATDGTTIWVGDTGNKKIKQISTVAPFAVTTVAGNGTTGITDGIGAAANFDDLRGLTYYAGMLYLLDANGAVLRRFDPKTKEVVTLAGMAYQTGVQDGVAGAARFISPRYMTSDNSGMLYIADTNGYHIRTYNTVSQYVGTFAGTGMAGYVDGVGAQAAIHRPRGMASDGTSIYFTEFNQHTVRQGVLATQEVSTNVGKHCNGQMCAGGYAEGVGTAALLNGPFALAYHHPSKTLFVVDSGNKVIRKIQ